MWLARGSAYGELFRNLTINGQRVASVTPLVGGAIASVRDFKNLAHSVSFTTERSHATLQAANLFAFLHAAQINAASGTITAVSESSGAEQAIYLKNAVITSANTTQEGIATATAYTITCGEISTTI